MKKRLVIPGILLLILLSVILLSVFFCLPSEKAAEKRVLAFAHEINYNHPERIYSYLTADFRGMMDKNAFVEAFRKERSYPYLTPFYINFLELQMNEDNRSGIAYFSVAARLPGEIYEQPFVYENGNYYMIAFETLADGSYLKKFDRLK